MKGPNGTDICPLHGTKRLYTYCDECNGYGYHGYDAYEGETCEACQGSGIDDDLGLKCPTCHPDLEFSVNGEDRESNPPPDTGRSDNSPWGEIVSSTIKAYAKGHAASMKRVLDSSSRFNWDAFKKKLREDGHVTLPRDDHPS